MTVRKPEVTPANPADLAAPRLSVRSEGGRGFLFVNNHVRQYPMPEFRGVRFSVKLPGQDGLEVCRRLRAAEDLPILLLTARDATAERVLGLDTCADDYLVKTFAYDELLARERAMLSRSAPAASDE